ncbi:hypothetical protein RFI_11686, partial [Reticulomyxa filosa]
DGYLSYEEFKELMGTSNGNEKERHKWYTELCESEEKGMNYKKKMDEIEYILSASPTYNCYSNNDSDNDNDKDDGIKSLFQNVIFTNWNERNVMDLQMYVCDRLRTESTMTKYLIHFFIDTLKSIYITTPSAPYSSLEAQAFSDLSQKVLFFFKKKKNIYIYICNFCNVKLKVDFDLSKQMEVKLLNQIKNLERQLADTNEQNSQLLDDNNDLQERNKKRVCNLQKKVCCNSNNNNNNKMFAICALDLQTNHGIGCVETRKCHFRKD